MIIIAAPFFCFLVASNLLFIIMAEDITKNLMAFNRMLKTLEDRDDVHVELMDRFCAVIQIHSDGKQ